MMTIATAPCKTATNHATFTMACGLALNGEDRAPDWTLLLSLLGLIRRACSDDDPWEEDGSWAVPAVCAPENAASCSSCNVVSIPTRRDAVSGELAYYAAGISYALGQHLRRTLARHRNRFGGRG